MPQRIELYGGPRITTVVAAPTIDEPIGSLALRHDATGAGVYFKASTGTGGWVLAASSTGTFTPMRATLTRTTAQSIPNNTAASISFDTSVSQVGATFWVIGSPTLVTIPAAGTYDIRGYGCFSTGGGTYKQARIIKNGSTAIAMVAFPVQASSAAGTQIGGVFDFALSDTVELQLAQDSGGAQNTGSFGAVPHAYVTIVRIA